MLFGINVKIKSSELDRKELSRVKAYRTAPASKQGKRIRKAKNKRTPQIARMFYRYHDEPNQE